MKIKLLVTIVMFKLVIAADAQSLSEAAALNNKMQWFADAKLGIFIHEGIYAVNGIDESWSFYNKKISYRDYMKQLKGFTLKKYDPSYWADLIKQSGARYAVITTKHHDGVSMSDSQVDSLNIVRSTPARQDLIKPLFAALRKRNIKCGAYFSLLDWSNDNYTGFTKDSSRYQAGDDYSRWNKFRSFFQAQIMEINQQFTPDLWWFDGDWEHSAEEWEAAKVRSLILKHNKSAIINGRLQGYGDYQTPEQNFPVSRPAYPWWELCMTLNNNWGYHPDDTQWKTPYQVITIFTDVVANGGNLLLDIGPRADGSIPQQDIDVLTELGEWNRRNGEAIFNTTAGIPQGHFYGPTTLSKDGSTLYLFLQGNISGSITLKGLLNTIKDITVLGLPAHIDYKIVGKISWSKVPGLVYIDIPKGVQDKYVTVLKVSLDGPVKLYNGNGGL